jgi:hypothetical protein
MPPAVRITLRPTHALSIARLMEYSENHLARAAYSERQDEALVASRLLEDVPLYSSWERSHHRLMHRVAAANRPAAQLQELRKISFQTLHRKAPFEYLRQRRLTSNERRRLIQKLFGPSDHFTRAIVREHNAYIHSAGSYLCVDSLCDEQMGDGAFSEALSQYEMAYGDFYRAYCDSLLEESDGEGSPLQSLLPYLRYQLKVIRDHLLAGAPQKSDFKQLQSLYAATGDTQRLPVLDINLAP